jgi:hypothetical protein
MYWFSFYLHFALRVGYELSWLEGKQTSILLADCVSLLVFANHCFSVGSGSFGSIFLMILAGLPATQWKSGTSLVTTLPAPITQPLPMVTPGRTVTLPPNHYRCHYAIIHYL